MASTRILSIIGRKNAGKTTLTVALASEQRNIPVVNTLKENRLVGALGRGEVLGIFSEIIAARSKTET